MKLRKNIWGVVFISLFFINLSVSYAIAPTKLQWDKVETNEDGTPLTDLGGYKVYCGSNKMDLSEVKDVGNVTEVLLTELNPVCKYFTVTAYNKSKIESKMSEEICSLIAPSPPVGGCRLIR